MPLTLFQASLCQLCSLTNKFGVLEKKGLDQICLFFSYPFCFAFMLKNAPILLIFCFFHLFYFFPHPFCFLHFAFEDLQKLGRSSWREIISFQEFLHITEGFEHTMNNLKLTPPLS